MSQSKIPKRFIVLLCIILVVSFSVGTFEVQGASTPDSGAQVVVVSALASSSDGGRSSSLAVDGVETFSSCWWSAYGTILPQWLRLDLGSLVGVNQVVTHFYDGDGRVYTYFVEVSADGSSWTVVVPVRSGSGLVTDAFSAVAVRFVRIVVTGNSANRNAHVIEVRVYGSSSPLPAPAPAPSPSPSPSISPGVISITFDDGIRSQYTTAFPLMQARGIVGTFYIPTAQYPSPAVLYNRLSASELQQMQAAGNEIGSHSVTHRDFTKLSDQEIAQECLGSKQYLQSTGLVINNFAYPYGTGITEHIDSIVSTCYRSARIAGGAPMSTVTFELTSTSSGWGLNTMKGFVDRAKTQKMWATIYFHDIGGEFSVADFAAFLDYAKASNVRILTVNQALDQFV